MRVVERQLFRPISRPTSSGSFSSLLESYVVRFDGQVRERPPADGWNSSAAIRVPGDRIAAAELLIEWRPPASDLTTLLAAVGLNTTTTSLVIAARNPFLKLAEVLFEGSLEHVIAEPFTIRWTNSGRPRVLQGSFSGFDLSLSIVCTADSDTQSNLRRGALLARHTVKVRPEGTTGGFNIQPLTAATRKQFCLNSRTLRHIEFSGDVTSAISPEDSFQVFVDADLLTSLHGRSKRAQALQFEYMEWAATLVLLEASLELKKNGDAAIELVPLDGMLAKLLRRLEKFGKRRETTAALRELAEHPQTYISLLDPWLGLLDKMKIAMEED